MNHVLTTYHIIFIFVLGTVFGSFLNVVIYRLPRGLSLIWPPSACPECGTRIRFYDNIPLLSFVLLLGKCRHCRGRISIRYPLVELASGLLLVWVMLADGPPGLVTSRSVLVLFLLAVALIDWEHMIIPDELSLSGCVMGFVLSFFNPSVTVTASLLGIFVGGGLLLGVAYLYQRVRGVEGLGGGDVKLAAMIGAFIGWKGLVLCVLTGSVAGSLYGIALMLGGRGSQTKVPFGTFLAAGAVFAALYSDAFLRWYAGVLRG